MFVKKKKTHLPLLLRFVFTLVLLFVLVPISSFIPVLVFLFLTVPALSSTPVLLSAATAAPFAALYRSTAVVPTMRSSVARMRPKQIKIGEIVYLTFTKAVVNLAKVIFFISNNTKRINNLKGQTRHESFQVYWVLHFWF